MPVALQAAAPGDSAVQVTERARAFASRAAAAAARAPAPPQQRDAAPARCPQFINDAKGWLAANYVIHDGTAAWIGATVLWVAFCEDTGRDPADESNGDPRKKGRRTQVPRNAFGEDVKNFVEEESKERQMNVVVKKKNNSHWYPLMAK